MNQNFSLWCKCLVYIGYFSLGYSLHFLNFYYLVARKRLVVKQNRPKFGPRGWVILTLNCSSSIWSHLVHFWIFTPWYLGTAIQRAKRTKLWVVWCIIVFRGPCISKTSGRRVKRTKKLPSDVSFVHAEYLSLLSVQGHSGVIQCVLVFDDLVSNFDLSFQGYWIC